MFIRIPEGGRCGVAICGTLMAVIMLGSVVGVFSTALIPAKSIVQPFSLGVQSVKGDFTYVWSGTYSDGTTYSQDLNAKNWDVKKHYGILGHYIKATGKLDGMTAADLWTWYIGMISKAKTYYCDKAAGGGFAAIQWHIYCQTYTLWETGVSSAAGDDMSRLDVVRTNYNNFILRFVLSSFIIDGTEIVKGDSGTADDWWFKLDVDEYRLALTESNMCYDMWLTATSLCFMMFCMSVFGFVYSLFRLYPKWDTDGKGGIRAITISVFNLAASYAIMLPIFFYVTCAAEDYHASSKAAGVESWSMGSGTLYLFMSAFVVLVSAYLQAGLGAAMPDVVIKRTPPPVGPVRSPIPPLNFDNL